MPQRPTNTRPELREEAKKYYRDKKNIETKWLDQYGNISLEDDYQRNRSCLSEVFNMLDVVMENYIDDFRKTHVLLSAEPAGPRTAFYTYEGDNGKTIAFRTPSVFASRATALRAIGYKISDELFYDTRLLRNETTHGNKTIVLQHMQLSYADTMKAMLSMADTLIELGALDPSLRVPPFERLRVREEDSLSNGAYTIESLIGEGGMSRVYAATQTRIGRRIAIKELKPETYSEDLIRNEYETLLRLHHDLIPQIHDIFYENATWYIAMDYVDGMPLDRRISEKPSLDNAARQTICRSLLDILQYLHSPEVQIVFTDLSPDNIIIDKKNLPHLIDFGISGKMETRQTLPAATLGYSAPEVFSNRILDQRSDIYSFGCILRFLYTGLSPLEKSEQPTSELVHDSRIASVINRCMSKNPEERYATAEELQAALFPETPESPKTSGSRRPLIAVGAVAAAAAVGLGIFASARNRQQEDLSSTASVSASVSSVSEITAESDTSVSSVSEITTESDTSETGSESSVSETVTENSTSDTVSESSVSESASAESTSETISESSSSEIASVSNLETEADSSSASTVSELPEPTPPTEPAPTPVVFPSAIPFESSGLADHAMDWHDAGLEQKMREVTGIISGDIMLSDVWGLQELYITDGTVTDVSALSELTQLTALYLGGNPINADTVTALTALPDLMILDLSNCGLTDISFLQDFSNLQELYLGHNTLTDLSPLKNFGSLTMLELQYNPIGENSAALDVISGLTSLTWLDMKECGVTDLDFLIPLQYLMNTDLSNNQIADLTPLRYTTLLEYLDVSSNAVTDLSPLSGLTNLSLLYAFHNDLSGDLNALSSLTKLEYLDLHKNSITDISALKNLTSLIMLDLEDNEITDFSVLDGMHFEELYT
ncbi:MAG: leucine-rich repeat domain-containing protein [Eubacterium sp.]|nr:leucine-rich repeat domain-containing protein [Eubacterium sp.]